MFLDPITAVPSCSGNEPSSSAITIKRKQPDTLEGFVDQLKKEKAKETTCDVDGVEVLEGESITSMSQITLMQVSLPMLQSRMLAHCKAPVAVLLGMWIFLCPQEVLSLARDASGLFYY